MSDKDAQAPQGAASPAQAPEGEAQNQQPVFEVLRTYAKDCSLETPGLPQCFLEPWHPDIKVEFDSKPTQLAPDQVEVDLRVTVTCRRKPAEDKNANAAEQPQTPAGEGEEGPVIYICEVHQAGIFLIRNFPQEAIEYLIAGVAPNLLFPYAREHVSSLINRASFPPLNLHPYNFEAMLRARKAEEAAKRQAAGNAAATK